MLLALAVTPYCRGPQTVDDQLASLSEYDWSQTIVGEPNVVLLGPDVALRTFIAIERFYQVTTLEP